VQRLCAELRDARHLLDIRTRDRDAAQAELKLLRGLLKDCRPYVEDASNDAERAYNDRGGPQYLSPMRLEVKARADALLAQIDLSTQEHTR
jgi:hypothetical protein